MPRLAWCITGAVCFLSESVSILESIAKRGIGVTIYVSRAAENILRTFGLYEKLDLLSQQSPHVDIVLESNEVPSFPTAARVLMGEYDMVVVAPTTLNTLAKITWGICDSLITVVVSYALRLRVPVIVLAPDVTAPSSFELPLYIDYSRCCHCSSRCIAAMKCPRGALVYKPHADRPRLYLSRCDLCGKCVEACPNEAIMFRRRVLVHNHPLAARLVEATRSMGILIVSSPEELQMHILSRVESR